MALAPWMGRSIALAVKDDLHAAMPQRKKFEEYPIPTFPWDSSRAPIPTYQTYKDFLQGLSQYLTGKKVRSLEYDVLLAAMRFLVDDTFRSRIFVDRPVAVSVNAPFQTDFADRSYVQAYSQVGIILRGTDGSMVLVPPNRWTSIPGQRGQSFTAPFVPDSAPIFIILRSSDHPALPLEVDATGTTILTFTAPTPTSNIITSLDVSGYKELAFQFSNGDGNFVTVQGSIDNINFPNVTAIIDDIGNTAVTSHFLNQIQASNTNIWTVPINFRYFRLAYTGSVTPTATIWLSKEPGVLKVSQTFASPGPSLYNIGFIQNWGTALTDIAAGLATDTLISQSQLGIISIVSSGTNPLQIFDSNTVNPIPGAAPPMVTLPANAATGVYPVLMIVNSGIAIKGNANNPGVRIQAGPKGNN